MYLVTKSQLLTLFESWGTKNAAVPTKKLQTVIAFPRTAAMEFNAIVVKKTSLKATQGGPLFSVEFKNL